MICIRSGIQIRKGCCLFVMTGLIIILICALAIPAFRTYMKILWLRLWESVKVTVKTGKVGKPMQDDDISIQEKHLSLENLNPDVHKKREKREYVDYSDPRNNPFEV